MFFENNRNNKIIITTAVYNIQEVAYIVANLDEVMYTKNNDPKLKSTFNMV